MSINDESLKKEEASSSSNSTRVMGLDDKYQILRSTAEECIGEGRIDEGELRNLLVETPEPICYDGFEPSGRMDLAQGIMKIINVKKMISAGCRVKIVIADVFAILNNRMGGDKKKIEDIGNYIIEIWKAAAGKDLESGKVEFIWSSKEINARADEYWPLVMDIAGKNSLNRMTSCCQIMGLNDPNELTAAQILYPLMQCADIFFLKADICQLGMDKREVNVLAREYCDSTKRKNKPIVLSHHMLPALQQGQENMSKSDPTSSIFMEDDKASVNLKIKKAYCPPKIVHGNPCLEYIKYIVFPWSNEFTIERKPDHGGNKKFKSFEELIVDYESEELHPSDLKTALAKELNKILEPVRRHFAEDENAKKLFEKVKRYCNTSSADRTKTLIMESEAAVPTQAVVTMLIPDKSQKKKDSSSSNSNHVMGLEEKYQILRSIGEECIMEYELRNLLAKKPEPICYDGFEPSGRMHIAQGIMKTINVNKMTSAGCRVKIWIADWFAMLNNKMGGDPEKIKVVGKYLIEIWKAAGMDLKSGKVEFLWSSKEINARADEYWPLVMNIARKNSVNRITRCCQIMGRSDKDVLTAAQILYPCMQCADIFFLKADICQLGMDQRKVNVLAREYCDDIKRKHKPIILSHHMLPGLHQGQEKMSKSDPTSSIFMEDDEESVKLKIEKAYCPPLIVEGNPCLEYLKYIVFPWSNEFTIRRSPDHGGDKKFKSFEELIANYESGELQPSDLKPALAEELNKILEPVRHHFAEDKDAKELFDKVKEYYVTR